MNDHLLQFPLCGGPLQDLLVDGVGRDQAVHHHGLGLANPVTPVLGLQVSLGVLDVDEGDGYSVMCRARLSHVSITCGTYLLAAIV